MPLPSFHSAQDKRLPENFVCFDCRVRADKNWDLIEVHELYPRMMSKFREIALFRQVHYISHSTTSDFLH